MRVLKFLWDHPGFAGLLTGLMLIGAGIAFLMLNPIGDFGGILMGSAGGLR
jgi:hypothetical protein